MGGAHLSNVPIEDEINERNYLVNSEQFQTVHLNDNRNTRVIGHFLVKQVFTAFWNEI